MPLAFNPEFQIAIDAVRDAALLARGMQEQLSHRAHIVDKSDLSPVTIGDFAVQAMIAKRLHESFPNDPLVSEESTALLRQSAYLLDNVVALVQTVLPQATPENVLTWIEWGEGAAASRFWTLDPIDGTKGFIRGDQYAVALALIVEGQVTFGILGCPNLHLFGEDTGTLMIASRGHGTWMAPLMGDTQATWIPAHVSTIRTSAQSRVLHSVESSHFDPQQLDAFLKNFGTEQASIAMDSQAKYAYLAAGKADCLVRLDLPHRPRRHEKIWDHAAGTIVVEEAGGTVTDLDGRPLLFDAGEELVKNRGAVASNGLIHTSVLNAISRV